MASASEEKKPKSKQQPDLVESLAKHFPKETGELMLAIKDVLVTMAGANPEQIRADLQIQSRVTLGFMLLMGTIIVVSALLAWQRILAGETIAFIFGTAFGSVVTFLYKFLTGTEE